MLRNVPLINLLLTAVIVTLVTMVAYNIWCQVVPLITRYEFENAGVSRVFDCDYALCSVEFAEYRLTLKVPKPVTVGEHYNLAYEWSYNRRTGKLKEQRLLRADKIKPKLGETNQQNNKVQL